MLHACVQKFDVTGNVEIFFETKCDLTFEIQTKVLMLAHTQSAN